MKRFSLLLCSLVFSLNCFSQALEEHAQPAENQDVSIDKQYVRATPPHAKNSAAFLMLTNNTDKEIKLVAVSSDIAERVELHNHIKEDGMMKMRQVEEVTIAANGNTSLQPGGYHVMFLGLKKDLTEGENVDIRLFFDNGDELNIEAPVKKINMSNKKKHTHTH